MNWRDKFKDMKVREKLGSYRTLVLVVTVVMGLVAGGLSIMMHVQVRRITENWSPALSKVMEMDTLTSDYRMKQYAHLVATTEGEMAGFEKELSAIEANIGTVSAEFESLLSEQKERELYEVIISKWTEYKTESTQVLKLSGQNKLEEGNKLMLGPMLDTYNDFQESFAELKAYEESQLALAKRDVSIMFYSMMAVMVLIVVGALILVERLGKLLIGMITTPVEQITEAAKRMYQGDMSAGSLITYESADEFGVVSDALRGAMKNLSDYIDEISGNLREIAKGDLTKQGDEITDLSLIHI